MHWSERGRGWLQQAYPEDLDFAFDFGHAEGAVYISSPDELHSNLLTPSGMEAELYLAKLTLAEGLEKEIWAELWDLSARVGGGIGYCGWVSVDVDVSRLVILLSVRGALMSPRRMSSDGDRPRETGWPWRLRL